MFNKDNIHILALFTTCAEMGIYFYLCLKYVCLWLSAIITAKIFPSEGDDGDRFALLIILIILLVLITIGLIFLGLELTGLIARIKCLIIVSATIRMIKMLIFDFGCTRRRPGFARPSARSYRCPTGLGTRCDRIGYKV